MTAVVCQIEDQSGVQDRLYGRRVRMVQVLDEIVLPNSNTAEMCEAFVSRVRSWGRFVQPYTVRLYGDAAGAARSTAGHSDYEIIRQFFRTQPDFHVSYHSKSSNPAVRDRVNAVNAMLCNHQGERRLLVNPRCKQLIRDLERVSWKADSHDNLLPQLDKTNPGLTHISDALGYLIETEFGLRGNREARSQPPSSEGGRRHAPGPRRCSGGRANRAVQTREGRFQESRFSAARSQGNCASSIATASAAVGLGVAHSGTVGGGTGIRARRVRRARWLRP